jgi:DNA polymerase-1
VKDYIDSTTAKVREAGFVQTLLGRIRTIREIQSESPVMRKAGERAAINAPIQGTAAYIVKLAMVRIADSVSVPMISQVHDELIFEAPEPNLRSEAAKIVKIMESVIELSVPLKVNWAIGANWDEAH